MNLCNPLAPTIAPGQVAVAATMCGPCTVTADVPLPHLAPEAGALFLDKRQGMTLKLVAAINVIT
jgi:hypothetical protein